MKYWILLGVIMAPLLVKSQGLISVNDPIRDYARLLEIQGIPVNNPLLLHNNQTEIWQFDSIPADSLGPWKNQLDYYKPRHGKGMSFYLLSPQVDYVFNSKYPRTYNDGPVWNGRGHNVAISAGVKGKWGPLSATLYPTFYHSQNKLYKIQSGRDPSQNVYNYQLAVNNTMDWVQRYGVFSLNEFDWGQSNIALTYKSVHIKFGSENMWIGSPKVNPILMSNTATGFPNLQIGTVKPVRTKWGDFELNGMWGQLYESEFFDEDITNDQRYIVGLTFGYRPSFSNALKGLSIGLSRILYSPWPEGGLGFGDLLLPFKNVKADVQDSPIGNINDSTDQYFGLDLRWRFEKSKAEIYFEYVRNDFWLNFQDLVMEPEHSSYFTLGLQKVFKGNKHDYRFGFEHTSLAVTRTREIRASELIYVHGVARQGYTHKGQPLGAGVGPGAKSQLIRVDQFREKGRYSFSIHRIRFNDDFFFHTYGPVQDFLRHDVEWNFGFEAMRFYENFEFTGKFTYSRRMNMHYYPVLDVNNFQFLTTIRYHIFKRPLLTLLDK